MLGFRYLSKGLEASNLCFGKKLTNPPLKSTCYKNVKKLCFGLLTVLD